MVRFHYPTKERVKVRVRVRVKEEKGEKRLE